MGVAQGKGAVPEAGFLGMMDLCVYSGVFESHSRLYRKDVLAFRCVQLERESKVFDDLRALAEEWGVLDRGAAALGFVAQSTRCHVRVICPPARRWGIAI